VLIKIPGQPGIFFCAKAAKAAAAHAAALFSGGGLGQLGRSATGMPIMNQDDELLAEQAQAVRQMFERIPFNQALGIELDEISTTRVMMHLPMKPELVGNFVHGILHGGVIASLLDVAGGAMAMLGAFDKHRHLTTQERAARLSRLGTIDLRIDYLRPGRGTRFSASAMLLRSGNKVAVVRSELHNETGVLVAVGTGTYLCG
jgi:uncharacterized protein (TIGR00369 family)